MSGVNSKDIQNVRVDIIVPCFNSEKYLSETITSLLRQEYKCFRIIIINDGSTDSTKRIIEEFCQLDERVEHITLLENRGQSYSINTGWRYSSADLISIISSDDPQDKDWLSNAIDTYQEDPTHIIYYPNLRIINAIGQTIKKIDLYSWNNYNLFGRMLCVASAGSIINRKLLPDDFKPRDEKLRWCSDLDQMHRISDYGTGKKIWNCLGNWRNHSDNESNAGDVDEKVKEFEKYVFSTLNNRNLPTNVRSSAIIYSTVQIARWYFSQRSIHKMLRFLCSDWRIISILRAISNFVSDPRYSLNFIRAKHQSKNVVRKPCNENT